MIQGITQFLNDPPSWILPVILLLGFGLLIAGGNWLVDGAVRIARRAGVSTLLIGLTVVAAGTSSPELAFNLTSAIDGHSDLAFGNIIGSNIANVALVLGVAAIVAPIVVSSRIVKKELPLLIGVSAITVALAWMPPHVRDEAGGTFRAFTWVHGTIFMAGVVLVTWIWFRMARRDRADPFVTEAEGVADRERIEQHASLPGAIGLTVLGLAALVAGGKVTEYGAVLTAERLEMPKSLVGLTIVAFATSLPELVTAVIACRRGHSDLAIGNVIGSNLFNILLVLGATSLVEPVRVAVEPAWLGLGRGWWDLFVMLGVTVVLFPIAATDQRRILRAEGVFLLVCYVGYLTLGVLLALR